MIGVPANCAACYHFITQAARNKNSFFFKRLYTLISVLDILIGFAQLPLAQTLLLGTFGYFVFNRTGRILWRHKKEYLELIESVLLVHQMVKGAKFVCLVFHVM